MRTLRSMFDADRGDSLSQRMRHRRFALFERLAADLPRPLHILDVGGTVSFWEHRGWAGRGDVEITLINLTAQPSAHANVRSLAGSATDLGAYADASVDIVFSNSVIEHLFTYDQQQMMAAEVRRVGRGYWVQTPNYWFPIEPHYLVPGWQWMPRRARIEMLRRFRCGWRGPYPDPEVAARFVDEVRLMTRREVAACFPDAHIHAERFAGIVKSWVAIGGTLRRPLDQ